MISADEDISHIAISISFLGHRLTPVLLHVMKKRETKMKYKVTGGNLNVRKEPSTDSQINHILTDGEEIEASEAVDGWCAFGSGYVMAKWLEPISEDTAPEKPKKTTRKSTKKAAAK